jgi:DNA-binding transcriptional MerR regulator
MLFGYYFDGSKVFPDTKGYPMKQAGIKKLYYSISEVSKITGLEQYVLRYWETEFEQLKPSKNRAGNRIYTNRDIKTILYIKKLLREERYTIEGAKQVLQMFVPENEGEQLELIADAAGTPVPTAESFMTTPPPPVSPSQPHREADTRVQRDLVEVKKFLEEMLIRLT